MHDFTYPANPAFRHCWQVYFHLMNMVGKRVYPEWRTVFEELPQFLQQTSWLPETLALLDEHGFCDISRESLTFGASAIVTARRPETPPNRTS